MLKSCSVNLALSIAFIRWPRELKRCQFYNTCCKCSQYKQIKKCTANRNTLNKLLINFLFYTLLHFCFSFYDQLLLCVSISLLLLPLANHASHTVGSAILTTCTLCLCLLIQLLSFSIGLWNCQSAVNKADFITSISSHSRLNLIDLT